MLAAQMRQYMASLRHNLRQILRYSAKIFNETPTRRRRLPLRRVAAAVTLTHTALQLNFVHTSTTHAHDSLSSVQRSLSSLLAKQRVAVAAFGSPRTVRYSTVCFRCCSFCFGLLFAFAWRLCFFAFLLCPIHAFALFICQIIENCCCN